ncbi:MAG: 50S ribosomal protein L18e [Candidatus Aenigmarchaeota archaeon]|nr:50S ribosomal protein L18e [Candidatus Aenigmarchaeota archaeon]
MVKRTGPTNPILKKLIEDLREKAIKTQSNFLRDIAEKLNKPRRQRIEVNIAHIERYTKKDETVIVPGVVLGYGELSKPVTVSAWKFSGPAREKIEKVKGKAISIEELVKKNPRGTNLKILC